MKLLSHIHEAKLNLFSSKLRTLLALLGILVGTAAVVAMVSGGKLATNEALKQFQTLGTDLLAINLSDSPSPNGGVETQSNLSITDAKALVVPSQPILKVAPYVQIYNPLQFGGKEISGGVIGVTESFGAIAQVDILQGRFISDLDGFAYYCVIGSGIYEQMQHISNKDPIGQHIQIDKNIFTIIGIAKPWAENSFIYANIDTSILIPIKTASLMSKYATINNIIVSLKPDTDIDGVKNYLEAAILQHAPSKKLFVRSAKELISKMAKQSEILTIFLGLIGGISLLVGGIGVMNIMLVSVVERRREIGIRLAIGATREDIRLLFLIEAVMLALIGGGLGVIIGILISYVIALISQWDFTLFLLPPLIGFVVSAATGIFFGFYPAYQASNLDPIDALRSE
jgi:putative ABC transport system permease protein